MKIKFIKIFKKEIKPEAKIPDIFTRSFYLEVVAGSLFGFFLFVLNAYCINFARYRGVVNKTIIYKHQLDKVVIKPNEINMKPLQINILILMVTIGITLIMFQFALEFYYKTKRRHVHYKSNYSQQKSK